MDLSLVYAFACQLQIRDSLFRIRCLSHYETDTAHCVPIHASTRPFGVQYITFLHLRHSLLPSLRLLRYLHCFMVDIHCHLLPGLDDGSESAEMSLEMAESAVSEGITHVIATPHANSQFDFIPKLVRLRRDEIQERLGNRLQIASGCDFHLSYENLLALRDDPSRFTLNQKAYLLVEFDDFSIPATLDQALHELRLQGLRPIITHPERNPLIRGQLERLWKWMHQGCFVQVTAQSFLGGFGQKAQQAAEALLDAGAIHFIASDAHNTTTRPLRLKETFEIVAARKGEEVARALFQENPFAALEGRPLPYLREPAELSPTRHQLGGSKPRKRFWFF